MLATSLSVGNAAAETMVEPTPPTPPTPVVVEIPTQPEIEPIPPVDVPVLTAPVALPDMAPAAATTTPGSISGANQVSVATSTAAGDGANGSDGAAATRTPMTTSTRAADDLPPIQTRNHCATQWGFHGNGNQCSVNICHATGSETNPYVFITISENGLNGHFNGNHQMSEDVIGAASASECPGGSTPPTDACPDIPGIQPPGTDCGEDEQCPAGSFPQGGTCKINICHATGSSSNPYVFNTVSVNGLEGHGDHPNDIIPAPSNGICAPDDECPDIPGNQPVGFDCTPDIIDVCPDIPGNQPVGTDCNPPVDACPNIPGNQPVGTDCNPPAVPPATPQAPPAASPAPPAAPSAPPAQAEAPAQPDAEPLVDETQVAGAANVPTEQVAAEAAGTQLPFTGAKVFGLVLLALMLVFAGSAMTGRRGPRQPD